MADAIAAIRDAGRRRRAGGRGGPAVRRSLGRRRDVVAGGRGDGHGDVRRAEARARPAPGVRPRGRAGGRRHRHRRLRGRAHDADACGCWRRRTRRRPFRGGPRAAHKGDFGHVLVIGGSPGKTGAAVLAANGAFAAGAGLVTIATAASSLPLVVAAARPEIMTEGLTSSSAGPAGPFGGGARAGAGGIARRGGAGARARRRSRDPGLRARDRSASARCPIVIDADALNALSGDIGADFVRRDRPTVLTPHPGEMARLLGSTAGRRAAPPPGDRAQRRGRHRRRGRPEGPAHADRRRRRPRRGQPDRQPRDGDRAAPATSLAGIVGALLARGTDAWTAATSAVYVHGAAGDEAAARRRGGVAHRERPVASLPAVLRSLASR